MPGFKLLEIPKSAVARPAPQADSDLERLRAERAGLAGEFAKFQGASARLRETAAQEAAAFDAVAALTRSEADTLMAWATGGCAGKQPQPDQDERLRLALALSDARAAELAAELAGADVDRQQREVAEQLAAIDRQLETAVLDLLQQEQAALIIEYRALAEQAQKLGARIHGLGTYLGERGRHLMASGDAAGQQYLNRVSTLAEIKLPEFGCTLLEISEAARVWARKAFDLRGGGK